jgi:acetyltransferase-like isoleucine patch superfamily enzyme
VSADPSRDVAVGHAANRFSPHTLILGEPEIGAGTWIGAFTVIDGTGGLTIGDGCDIGVGTQIYTHSTFRRCLTGRAFPDPERSSTVIGNRVFISGNVVVNPGVTIGDEAAVLAGSVVTHDVPPRTVVAGVPARVVGRVEIEGDTVRMERLTNTAAD